MTWQEVVVRRWQNECAASRDLPWWERPSPPHILYGKGVKMTRSLVYEDWQFA